MTGKTPARKTPSTRAARKPPAAPEKLASTAIPDETVMALKNLRMMVRDVAQNWSVKLQGELAAVIEEIESEMADPAASRKKAQTQALEKIHKLAMDSKIKMNKGRLRDIQKLHQTIRNIRKAMEELDS